jgi:DNA-binding protein H-NS
MALKAFAESTANLAKSLKAERDEAREQYNNLATEHMLAINKICGERDKTELDEEMKFHHRTHSELVNANCRMLDMQNDNSQLADRLTELELHSTSELARLEQELADAREEAHRFRSLYYAKSGINKSASAFPWEDAK